MGFEALASLREPLPCAVTWLLTVTLVSKREDKKLLSTRGNLEVEGVSVFPVSEVSGPKKVLLKVVPVLRSPKEELFLETKQGAGDLALLSRPFKNPCAV